MRTSIIAVGIAAASALASNTALAWDDMVIVWLPSLPSIICRR